MESVDNLKPWFDKDGHRHVGTLCWTCEKAVNGCEWSLYFKPIEGWIAEPHEVRQSGEKQYDSYHITACPEYEWDGTIDIFYD